MFKRILAIAIIYTGISIAWLVLGGTMSQRSVDYGTRLSAKVAGLWGQSQVQKAPFLNFEYWTTKVVKEEVTNPYTKKTKIVKRNEKVHHSLPATVISSDVDVDFSLDHRKKGLLWYSTYGVAYSSSYSYIHERDIAGYLKIVFRFPTTSATYDDFIFTINGDEGSQSTPTLSKDNQSIVRSVWVKKGDRVDFDIAYKSRGLDFWRYSFGNNVNRIKDFSLTMNTNFDAIDFPDGSISPSEKEQTNTGWKLDWKFTNLISGFDIGMVMPKKLNPGPLAGQISLFAPVCLFFFFAWMFVITLLKKIDLHPINYLFLAASFFSFHLLFAYTVDRLPLTTAFIISSVVSVFLVISYLRLVVGIRFAAVEAGLSQIVYLVLFSYAHFYQGWTGLIVTIGSILTLFFIMQLTGRINWSEKFANGKPDIMSDQSIPYGKKV